jgi:thiaminase
LTQSVSRARLERTRRVVESTEKEVQPYVRRVHEGGLVREVTAGTFPIEGLRFYVEQVYHLLNNDMLNFSLYRARARNEMEADFFLSLTVAEKVLIDSDYLLADALGVSRQKLRASAPHPSTQHRTNYWSRLALYNLPGEIVSGMLANFSTWLAGSPQISAGLKQNYGLGNIVPGTDKTDTDMLDRFNSVSEEFRETALRIIATDMTGTDAEKRVREIMKLSVEYEAMVWDSYYTEGLRRAGGTQRRQTRRTRR